MGDLVTTRQSVLRRALALGAGAVGFGAAAGTAAAAGTGAAETDRSRITMRLTARHAETRGGADQRHAVLVDHRGVTVGTSPARDCRFIRRSAFRPRSRRSSSTL